MPSQIFYQLLYKAKSCVPQRQQMFSKYVNQSHHPLKFQLPELIVSKNKFLGENRFCFLNLLHQFRDKIDWNFQSHGKLWNYNLRYFDFVLDEAIAPSERVSTITEFYTAHLNNNISLEPYPTSLRIINWILFSSRHSIDDRLFFLSLKKQIEYLDKNREYHIAANHLLENYISLMVAALWLKHDGLFRNSFKGFCTEVSEQILPDGAHYELSTMYHSIIFSKLMLVYDCYQSGNWYSKEVTVFLRPYLSKMMGWLNAMQLNQSLPMLNDAAPDIAPNYNSLKASFHKLNLKETPIALNESGYRVIRSPFYNLVIDVANVSPRYQPGHTHSDALSFVLHTPHTPVFVDMGVTTYNNNATRQLERSTEMHNTVTIDRRNQSQIWSAFRVGNRAKVQITEETTNTLRACHNGYDNIGNHHCRKFMWSDKEITIEDEVKADASSVAEAHFHVDHSIIDELSINGHSIFFAEENITVIFERAISVTMQPYQQAQGFNKSAESLKIIATFNQYLTTKIRFS